MSVFNYILWVPHYQSLACPVTMDGWDGPPDVERNCECAV